MGTSTDLRTAGLGALVTAGLLAASLGIVWPGPETNSDQTVLRWLAFHGAELQLAAVLWLVAMLVFVAFATRFRDAMWLASADRAWVTAVFVQGAVVFATIATVAAAVAWMLADRGASRAMPADLVGALWGFEVALLRFAAWGLVVPVGVVSLVLARHSRAGLVSAIIGVLVAVLLVSPLAWTWSLAGFTAWLLLVGITLVLRTPAERALREAERITNAAS